MPNAMQEAVVSPGKRWPKRGGLGSVVLTATSACNDTGSVRVEDAISVSIPVWQNPTSAAAILDGKRLPTFWVQGGDFNAENSPTADDDESVTKLVSSANADSVCSTSGFPALTRWANK